MCHDIRIKAHSCDAGQAISLIEFWCLKWLLEKSLLVALFMMLSEIKEIGKLKRHQKNCSIAVEVLNFYANFFLKSSERIAFNKKKIWTRTSHANELQHRMCAHMARCLFMSCNAWNSLFLLIRMKLHSTLRLCRDGNEKLFILMHFASVQGARRFWNSLKTAPRHHHRQME